MTYCATLKSGTVIVFTTKMTIDQLLEYIETTKWLEVSCDCTFEKSNQEEVETNRTTIRSSEIQMIDYYVENEVIA